MQNGLENFNKLMADSKWIIERELENDDGNKSRDANKILSPLKTIDHLLQTYKKLPIFLLFIYPFEIASTVLSLVSSFFFPHLSSFSTQDTGLKTWFFKLQKYLCKIVECRLTCSVSLIQQFTDETNKPLQYSIFKTKLLIKNTHLYSAL